MICICHCRQSENHISTETPWPHDNDAHKPQQDKQTSGSFFDIRCCAYPAGCVCLCVVIVSGLGHDECFGVMDEIKKAFELNWVPELDAWVPGLDECVKVGYVILCFILVRLHWHEHRSGQQHKHVFVAHAIHLAKWLSVIIGLVFLFVIILTYGAIETLFLLIDSIILIVMYTFSITFSLHSSFYSLIKYYCITDFHQKEHIPPSHRYCHTSPSHLASLSRH